ncbi:MAG: acetylxylan esterase [Candidatus Hydrogenedentota bacterium]
MKRRNFLAGAGASLAGVAGFSAGELSLASASESEKASEPSHMPEVMRYLDRIYAEDRRAYACRATNPEAHVAWREEARPVLKRMLGLDRMEDKLSEWTPEVRLEEPETLDGYTRARGEMITEPDVSVPFYLLRPLGEGPFPLAVMPHGHGPLGRYAGISTSEKEKKKIRREDRDVGVQAAKRGYVVITPATRGLGCPGVPDINKRHGNSDCRSQMVHCLLAGRTPQGERVWDMARFIDWGNTLEEVDAGRVLMMGNSGGGVVTLYATACDTRITVGVASCSFSSFVRSDGCVQLCDCNLVPGTLTFGDAEDVAGLIAPRWFLAVHGAKDGLFTLADVERTAARTREVFAAAGVADHFDMRVGPEGHRFYKDLMWPFIDKAMRKA